MSRDYDYLFKLVIVGNSGVGKSSLLMRYADDSFSETYLTTIGVDFKFKTITLDDKKVKMQIWDTAGQERFRTITSAYYKGADSIILVYDTGSQASFADVERYWINEVESYAEKDVDLLLLGNKSDLEETRAVSNSDASAYAQKRNMEFFEVSAKTAQQVELAFSTLARKLMVKRDEKKLKTSGRLSKEGKSGKQAEAKVNLGDREQAPSLTERVSNGCC